MRFWAITIASGIGFTLLLLGGSELYIRHQVVKVHGKAVWKQWK